MVHVCIHQPLQRFSNLSYGTLSQVLNVFNHPSNSTVIFNLKYHR